MRPRAFAACLGLAAAVCLVVAYVNRDPAVEAVYFGEDQGSLFEPFNPWDGYLWLGAGVALLVVAVAVLLADALRARRS